jgi:hypothetical protein
MHRDRVNSDRVIVRVGTTRGPETLLPAGWVSLAAGGLSLVLTDRS